MPPRDKSLQLADPRTALSWVPFAGQPPDEQMRQIWEPRLLRITNVMNAPARANRSTSAGSVRVARLTGTYVAGEGIFYGFVCTSRLFDRRISNRPLVNNAFRPSTAPPPATEELIAMNFGSRVPTTVRPIGHARTMIFVKPLTVPSLSASNMCDQQ